MEESNNLNVFDARLERSLCSTYIQYLQAHESYFCKASDVLNSDNVLRHIVLTECKLASGEWIDVLSLALLPLTSLEGSRTDFNDLLQITDRRRTKNYMSVANALAVINRVLHRLEQWKIQRGLFDQLKSKVRGLEGSGVRERLKERKVFRTQSVSQVNAKTLFHKGSSAFDLFEPVQRIPLMNVVYDSEPVRIGWWHRLLILTPDSILICRVVGIWSLFRTIFNRKYEPKEYAVIETVNLQKGLSVHSENGLTWNLYGKVVVFRRREECNQFLTALQEAVLAA